jgi:hypothetical protein
MQSPLDRYQPTNLLNLPHTIGRSSAYRASFSIMESSRYLPLLHLNWAAACAHALWLRMRMHICYAYIAFLCRKPVTRQSIIRIGCVEFRLSMYGCGFYEQTAYIYIRPEAAGRRALFVTAHARTLARRYRPQNSNATFTRQRLCPANSTCRLSRAVDGSVPRKVRSDRQMGDFFLLSFASTLVANKVSYSIHDLDKKGEECDNGQFYFYRIAESPLLTLFCSIISNFDETRMKLKVTVAGISQPL